MNLQQIFLIISTIIGFISSGIAIRSIFQGVYKPQRITRLVLLIVSSIFFFSLLFLGNTTAIWLAVPQFLLSIIIFVLAFKYGMGGRSKFDIFILILALITILLWQTTKDSLLALNLSILVDFIGVSPTIVKCFKQPDTEEPKFYFSDVISAGFNILAVSILSWSELVFPIYIFGINILCFSLIFIGRKYNSNANPKLIT
jgi:hypothetical protein